MDTATPASSAHPESPVPGSPRRVLILGSTGSIGTQALDVIRDNPGRFEVVGLAAGGSDPAALAAQALEFQVGAVAVAKDEAVEQVRGALRAEAERLGRADRALPELLAGADAVTELVRREPADVVLNAVDGSRGLKPTLAALESGATLALANKESLVAGGSLVLRAAKPGQIVPVDSEHSALAQCLAGGKAAEVDRLVLTASGGPFRGRERHELEGVTLEEALRHPTWAMGTVVTINSATLVNKGLELIEARLLFDVDYDSIDVVVHPQSIVHSMVTFVDGSTLAQASPPNMRLPIALGLDWPHRIAKAAPPLSFTEASSWTFEPLDDEAFPAVSLARHAGSTGGCLPAIFNAANEEALAAFVEGSSGFTGIVQTVERTLAAADQWRGEPRSVDEVFAAEEWARVKSRELVAAGKGQ
ncbi:1-deoxy-D-xylulose-5-phosphate reductoisomerase [Saccharopolyspora sp. MS10]|uniref:1-deoxy-D-xylulose-5-phosphate reductoisomerase n=1 Tax=Saccharopolyspora sp. MS10 TaxID=3385973 RepID=UPI00399F0DEB